MAIVSAAVFKTQNAAIATALTVQYKDSAAVKVANEISNPKHPLRRALKLLNFNATTGVFTSNDTLIDAIYSGAGSARGTQNNVETAPVLNAAVTSATVENALPNNIVLTMNKNVDSIDNLSIAVGGTPVAFLARLVTIAGPVVTIVATAAIVNGNVVTIATGQVKLNDLSQATLAAQAVTNNVA